MRVILLLGGLKDPNANGLQRLTPYLEREGWLVRHMSYGWYLLRGFFFAPFNYPVARMLACFVDLLDLLGHQVYLIAHSNGAAIAMKASQYGAPFAGLIFFHAACERDAKLGERTRYLVNVRTKTDPILALSRIVSVVSPWSDLFEGSMGNSKPDVRVWDKTDHRVWELDATKEWGVRWSHAGELSEEKVAVTGPWVVRTVKWMAGEIVPEKENAPTHF